MPSLNTPLTKDDFINSRWQDVVNSSERKDCLTYDSAFWKKAQEAKEAGNIREQAVFEILAVVTSAAIKPESTDVKRTPPNHLVASHFIQQAVEAFRTIRGTKEETANAKARAEKIHKLLLQYQEESRKELIASFHKVDISEMVEQARIHVRGKNFQYALFKLALLGAPTNVPHLRQQVQKQAREFGLSNFFL